jgi:hypothetical protein
MKTWFNPFIKHWKTVSVSGYEKEISIHEYDSGIKPLIL